MYTFPSSGTFSTSRRAERKAMRKLLLLSLASLAFTALSLAQDAPQKRPMTFQNMMSMKRLGETSVSPDGKWLVYAVTTMSLEQNKGSREIFIQPISGGEPKKFAITRPGDSGVQFAADGKHILFLSSRQGSQQIWTADFDTNTGAADNATRLTNISTETDNALWALDSKSIVFTSSVYPDCPAITAASFDAGDKCNLDRDTAAAQSKVKAQIFDHLLYRHWNHYTGPKRSHLFLVSVESSAVRDLTPNDPHDVPPFSLGGDGGFAFSPDSKELAFTENLDPEPAISTNANIFTLDLTKPSAKPVKISTAKGGDFSPAYSPDGKFIAWRSQERAGYEADKFRLMLYDRANKSETDLLKGAKLPNKAPAHFDNWVDEIAWSNDSEHIFFVSGEKGEAPIYLIDISSNELRRYGKALGEWGGIHPIMKGDNPVVAGTLVRVDRPAEFVVGDLSSLDDDIYTVRVFSAELQKPSEDISPKSYEPYVLTHLNDALLAQLDLPKMQDFWFTAKDGTKLQGFLIPPPGFDAHKKYPVKFLIHGGPQGAWGDSWSYRWNAELFAANGYVVVMINPRGSTGYGQAVVDGVNGDWGGKPFTDLMEGLDVAEKKFPFIDKTRECALGASYGGYMANWILGHSDRFKCIVTHDGMFNPESAFGSTEELWFNEWEFKGRPWDYYGKPDDENPFHKWAPMRAAKNFKTPTLVVHGQLDYRLDVSEGFQLFTTLQLMHVPSKMLYFPDEGHWVLKPQNSELWWKTVNDWVDQWTAKAASSH
jgi:dipeptidyl aminopeptidase/acylaminoacyl peptidase